MMQWIRGVAIGLSVHGLVMVLFALASAAWTVHHWRVSPTTITIRPTKTVMPDHRDTTHIIYPEEQPYTQAVAKPPLILPLGNALLTLGMGLLQITAGLRNRRFQARTLGIVALLVGLPITGLFGLRYSGLALAVVGLYVYFQRAAIEIFRDSQGDLL